MAPKKATPSDEGMVDVIIAFNPADMSENGTTKSVTRVQATQMVNEGRARYADEADAPGPPAGPGTSAEPGT